SVVLSGPSTDVQGRPSVQVTASGPSTDVYGRPPPLQYNCSTWEIARQVTRREVVGFPGADGTR
ncbi:hypothetical protein, partial [Frankia sp. Cas3]|uniref:hypothetical protein n=1 Tax=Frankia sp. Cas3 TaxID=3073926 RepID=UPI002AD4F841